MQRLTAAILLIVAASLAEGAPLRGDVDSPHPGVLCDRKAAFCVDAEGISLGLTREYLGAEAEAAMLRRIRDAGGPGNYDLSWFGFSNGVDCKTRERLCRVSKHSDKVDTEHTRALFGR